MTPYLNYIPIHRYIFFLPLFFILLQFVEGKGKNKHTFDVAGIDISHYQGNIHWKAVESSGLAFVFIKATEGYTYQDPKFKLNWNNANQTKLKVGAYHYFSLCKQGQAQADNFIRSVKLDSGHLPPAVDIEFEGNCKQYPDKKVILAQINTYLQKMAKHFQTSPIIYTSKKFYEAYLKGNFETYTYWIRYIEPPSQAPHFINWSFWQYEVSPQLGIKGMVDKNYFKGSIEELENMTLPSFAP